MLMGIVERTTSKEVKTRFGLKKTYSIQVDGTWYSCGFTDPRVNTGDEVAFEATNGSYGAEITKGTLVKTGALAPTPRVVGGSVGPAVAAPAPKSGPSFAGRDRPFPIPPLHGDRAIIRQNALSHAARLLASEPGAISSDDQTADRVIAMARKFEAYACGDLDVVMAEKIVAKAAKSATKAAVTEELGE